MEIPYVQECMVGFGYATALFGLVSAWGRFAFAQTHRKNPMEAALHALMSMAMTGYAGLLIFFERSTTIGLLVLLHILLIWLMNTLTTIFVESKRGQLGGEYYFHTQVHFYLWFIHGLAIAYYAPMAYLGLTGAPLQHWPVLRMPGNIHWSALLLFGIWVVRTAYMLYYAVYALTHEPEPDARYHLDPVTRILSLKFYRTP